MIKESPEILAVARRYFQAVRARDGETLRNLLSASDTLRFVGTATEELWTGQALRDGIAAHFNEAPDFVEEIERPAKAFECGPIGWVPVTRRIKFAGTPEPVDFRTTLVLAQESGSWKLVQRHDSIGRPNPEIHGGEHTALDELAKLALSAGALTGQDGLATVMFTNIADSTTLAATLGDALWTGIVQDHLGQIRILVSDNAGQMIKSLGDSTMSAFPSARAAMSCAMAIQRQMAKQTSEPVLRLRTGIHTGAVVSTGDDVFGTVVNMAARITTSAAPGEIRLSDACRAMVGDSGFAFSDAATVTLKGLDGEHLLHRLEWQS